MFTGFSSQPSLLEQGKANKDDLQWVCVPVSYDILESMLRKGTRHPETETIEGVPQDATYKGSFFDKDKMEGYLIFEHGSFLKLKAGDFIPTIRIVVKKLP